MNRTFDLRLSGKHYRGISLAEAKQRILDAGYTNAYANMLIDPVAKRDYSPPTVGWAPGRRMNWTVNDVRMGYKTALFALEWKGHTREEAKCLLRCAKLLAEIESEYS